jgi:DNA primase
VEGYTDVISMHQAGIENVVSSSGTALTHGQIRMIHRFSENITVLYDGDAAGIKAALRGIDLLLEDGMNVKVVLLPDGEDPDSFAKKQNAEDFNQFIAENEVDFIRFKTKLLLEEVGDDPIKRAGLISNVVESIALIPNAITRSVYIQDCSQLLKMQERVLIAEINKISQRNYSKKNELKDREAARIEPREPIPPVKGVPAAGLSVKNHFDRYELQILRYVVRYANIPLYRKYEKQKRKEGKKVIEEDVLVEEGPGVTEFVRYDLERDNLFFTNELYRQIFDEAVMHLEDVDFDSGRYFLSHPDAGISRLASELMSDRYQLSKIHAKMLGEEQGDKGSRLLEENHLNTYVPRATTELKNAYVLHKIVEIKKELNAANPEEMTTLITQLQQLQEIKRVLSKELGERIVLRY